MKKTSFLLGLLVLNLSCSKTVKEIQQIQTPVENQETDKSPIGSSSWNLINQILGSEAPNLALADLVSKSVSLEDRKKMEDLFIDLTPRDIENMEHLQKVTPI